MHRELPMLVHSGTAIFVPKGLAGGDRACQDCSAVLYSVVVIHNLWTSVSWRVTK